jgi:MYXO-CTERM domain-containing protein
VDWAEDSLANAIKRNLGWLLLALVLGAAVFLRDSRRSQKLTRC